MVVGVEQMRKVPFFEFGEPEGFRELGQLHLKEGHGIDAGLSLKSSTSLSPGYFDTKRKY